MTEVMEQQMDMPINKPENSSSARSQKNTPRDETTKSTPTPTPSPSPSPRKETAVTTGLSPEKRLGLITAMGQFRPKTATPIQFYNFVREFCIMHNCSIDEAMDRAPIAWMELSTAQTLLYNSEMHAALPIPVPHHLIYRAIQMERAGHWKLASMPPTKGSCGSKYTVESFVPTPKLPKITKKQLARINQRPRWDNLAETSPYLINIPRARTLPTPPSAERKVRTLTPPEQRAQLAQQTKSAISLTRILTQTSLKGQQGRNKRPRSNHLKPTKSSMAKCIKLPPEPKHETKKQPKLPKLPKVKKVVKKVSSVSSKTDKPEKHKRVSSLKKKLKKT